jgi:Methyltransferase domain
MVSKGVQVIFELFGYRLVKTRATLPTYVHQYEGGYEEYRRLQIHHNKRKLQNVWADKNTLEAIREHLTRNGRTVACGICHGARNGFEVEWFRTALDADVIGTDISETATQFPHMFVWDFQDENPEWADKFDFVYTNSLDHAMEPRRALSSWVKQIKQGGRIYIEHTLAHSTSHASEMDPFGAHPMCMPYLFFVWGKGQYFLTDILEVPKKANKGLKVWIFVLERM